MQLGDYQSALYDAIRRVFSVDSPSGFCAGVLDAAGALAGEAGFTLERTNKGCGVITIPGRDSSKTVALSAHVDTLGAMVRSVTEKGELKFTCVGGPLLPTLDGEYCRIRTRDGRLYTGTFLSQSPAIHVFPDAASRARDEESMAVRLDERAGDKNAVKALGIEPGDYIFIDPKTVITDSGFLKSRFIDDKASVAILLTLLRILRDEGVAPLHTTQLFISTYEEVGHGAAYLPAGISELIAVDMGCIGLDLACTEYDVSICAKDSGGPYDYELVTHLVELAKAGGVRYAVDIYPRYGSDVGAARAAGHDIRGALIGPGVHASHGMERTHYEGMENTLRLILLYLGIEAA